MPQLDSFIFLTEIWWIFLFWISYFSLVYLIFKDGIFIYELKYWLWLTTFHVGGVFLFYILLDRNFVGLSNWRGLFELGCLRVFSIRYFLN